MRHVKDRSYAHSEMAVNNMPKKIKFESFKYQFLSSASKLPVVNNDSGDCSWQKFINKLDFSYQGGTVLVEWESPTFGALEFDLKEPAFYRRGDLDSSSRLAIATRQVGTEDPVKLLNYKLFEKMVRAVAMQAGYLLSDGGGDETKH